MNLSKFYLCSILVALCFQARMACNSNERSALSGFSNCLTSKIEAWNSSTADCCAWNGVTCDNSTSLSRRVIGLELGSKRLTGTVCESLAELEHLRILNLSNNFLHGTIPSKLFSLQNLEVLDLSKNNFAGPIPAGGDLPLSGLWTCQIII